MNLTDLHPPPSGPVTLAAAKIFLRVDHPDEDDLIRELIDVATRQIETRCGASLITRAQRLVKTATGPGVYLNRYPVVSVEAVERDGAAIPIDANLRARPVLVRVQQGDEIQVDFTAGFDPTPEDIPTPLRQGVLLLIAHLYEYRNGGDVETLPMGFPMMVDALIQPYRGIRL